MSTQPQPAPVLAWHREAAKAIEANHVWGRMEQERIEDRAAIIAAHDPHAAQNAVTVRLLEEAITLLDDYGRNRTSGIMYPDVKSWIERDHLAKLKGTR